MAQLAITIGHLLLGGLFVFAGFDHFTRFKAVSAMIAARGWRRPEAMLAAASVFEIVAGLGLALGLLRPWAAVGLAGFTVVASLMLLDYWRFQGPEREGMRNGFIVNIGLIGGLLIAFGFSL